MEKSKSKTLRSYRLDAEIIQAIEQVMTDPNCEFSTETALVEASLRKALGIKATLPKLPTVSNVRREATARA